MVLFRTINIQRKDTLQIAYTVIALVISVFENLRTVDRNDQRPNWM